MAWIYYDWKQEMRDRAIELLIKHSHNFDPEKMEKAKNADHIIILVKSHFALSFRLIINFLREVKRFISFLLTRER